MVPLDQHNRVHKSPVPDIGSDLVGEVEAMHIEDVPVERLLATLELFRKGEINTTQAAKWAGISEKRLLEIVDQLHVGPPM